MHCLLSTIQQGEVQQLFQSCRTAVHGAGRDGDSGASLTDLKCAVLHTQACKRSSQACDQPQQGSQSASASGEVQRGEYMSLHVFCLPGLLPWSCPFPICGWSALSMGVRPNCGCLSSPPKEREHNYTHPVHTHAAPLRPWPLNQVPRN